MEERRARGRPPVDPNGSNPVQVRVGNQEYDDALTIAEQHDMSVPELMRIGLTRLLRDVKSGSAELRRGRI